MYLSVKTQGSILYTALLPQFPSSILGMRLLGRLDPLFLFSVFFGGWAMEAKSPC